MDTVSCAVKAVSGCRAYLSSVVCCAVYCDKWFRACLSLRNATRSANSVNVSGDKVSPRIRPGLPGQFFFDVVQLDVGSCGIWNLAGQIAVVLPQFSGSCPKCSLRPGNSVGISQGIVQQHSGFLHRRLLEIRSPDVSLSVAWPARLLPLGVSSGYCHGIVSVTSVCGVAGFTLPVAARWSRPD